MSRILQLAKEIEQETGRLTMRLATRQRLDLRRTPEPGNRPVEYSATSTPILFRRPGLFGDRVLIPRRPVQAADPVAPDESAALDTQAGAAAPRAAMATEAPAAAAPDPGPLAAALTWDPQEIARKLVAAFGRTRLARALGLLR